MIAKRIYRGYEYGTVQLSTPLVGEGRWRWVAYPIDRGTASLRGEIEGTHEDAVRACEVAVDEALDETTE
jgi:hypothetical protein